MDATVEDKASRALAAAHAFLARSPVPSRRARARRETTRTTTKTTTREVEDDATTTDSTTTGEAATRAIALERSGSSNARASVVDGVASEEATRGAGERVNVNLRAAFDSTTTTTASTETEEKTEETRTGPEEGSVTVVDGEGESNEEEETEVEAVEAVEDAREETASAATREATLGFAPPGTPAKVTLELSSDSSDGEVVDSPNVREGALDEGEVTSGVKTVEAEEDSGAEGVFDVAIRRELEDKETSSPVAAARSEVSALREEVDRLRDELDGAKWSREALEARVVEAEKIAADARSKTIETALDPQNQLTPEQVAALRAEIEQVEYLKRLLARAEQMRNTARAETKKAREKHEQDLEIVRREVAAMDEEIDNLRKRVKNDKSKMEAMERATIEAADEFATLYARQENTRRLLAAAFFAVVVLVIRLFMSGGAFTLKNMYHY